MSKKPSGPKGKSGGADEATANENGNAAPAKLVRAPRVKSAKDAVEEKPITKPAAKVNGTASRAGVVAAAMKAVESAKAQAAPARARKPAVAAAPAPAPVAAPDGPVRIFQIYYESWHRDLLDPAFAPFDNIGTPTELMEFDIFEKIARSKAIEGADYWGALSWRYTEKTGLTGADLLKVIEANPDVDVFYCNPHVTNEAIYHNMWVQGETCHVDFLEISKALFEATGLPIAEFELTMPSTGYSSANYFVARPAFWNAYLPFIRKVVTLAEQKLSPEMRQKLHSQAADDRGLHGGSTYLPFIVERLFPLFMRTLGSKLKGHRVALPSKEQELNIHLRLLR
ncbi:MAG: hypothetical protein JWR77_137, partial [Rhizorhabdus sp.]|nr:hypothetical protein [Rhizorhabdus sp.]